RHLLVPCHRSGLLALVEVPLLVVAAPAGVDLELGAVAGAGGVEAAARLDADDGAVGVDAPLLVVAAPAGVDLHPGAVAGASGVETLVAVDADLLRGGVVGPLLVTAGVAVPELELGAVRGAGVGYVHAPVGLDAADLPVRARRGVGGRHGRRGAGVPARVVEGVQYGVVRGLLVAVAVEEQRAGAGAEPGVGVPDAPDRDAGAAGHRQAVVDDVLVRGGRAALDVQLGDVHVDAQVREALDGRAVVAVVGAVAVEVRLQADAVDRHAALLEVADHVVDARRLGPVPVVDVVGVVPELGGRVGGPRGPEGHLDPVVAGPLEVGVAPAAGVAVGEGLVDDVPGVHLAPVVVQDAVDVVDHRLAERAAGERLHPARLLGVPGERVAADPLAVLDGPVVDPVAVAEVELPAVGLQGVDLHLVLGGD